MADMRLAIIGDTHLGRHLQRYDMTPHIRNVMYQFVEYCIEIGATTAVHLGDLFDSSNPPAQSVKTALQWCNEFERRGINLFILTGNHDVSSRGVPSALEPIKAAPFKHVRVVERPQHIVEYGHELLFLPFPSPTLFTSEQWEEELLYAHGECDGAVLAFSHLNIEGCPLNNQEWVLRGGDFNIPRGIIDDLYIRTYSGHIHMAQEFEGICVVGAAERLRFSERDYEQAFIGLFDGQEEQFNYESASMLQVELDASKWAVESHPTTQIALGEIQDIDVLGKIVKLRRYVDEQTEVDWPAVEGEFYNKGALYVMMEAPIPVQSAGAEVVLETNVGEPLKVAAAFIKSKLPDKEARKGVYKRFKKIHRMAQSDE